MKQRLLKSFLLLCAFIVGSIAWADEKITDVDLIKDGGHYFIGCTVGETDYYLYVNPTESAKGVKKTSTNDATEFIFTQGTSGWNIQIVSSSKYITLPKSKDNAKVNVQDAPAEWTITKESDLLQLKINNFLLQGNSSSSLNFGSYASGQKNVWLLPASTKPDPALAFSSATAEATFGQEFTAPTLTFAEGFNGTVEYSSSVETVAQVMDTETGELRIVGGGTTVITATFAGNDDFKAGSASYTLTVTDNRVATTISQENITIDIADIENLTQLTPVVKDANDDVVAYTNSPTAEGLPEVYFEIVSDDKGIFGSFDSHGNIILNGVVGTATIKAIYNHFQLNSDYRPSECTFTITVYQPLNGIAEFCKLTNNTSGTLKLTDAVVLYVNGKDMFVRDATGAVDFYDTSLDYKAGDVLNGMITAKYTVYYKMPELTIPISNNTIVATAGSAPEPTEITTSDAADNVCNLVKLTNVKVTKDGTKFYVDDVQVYDKFKLNYTLEAGKTYDIVGIMIPYNTIYEICPIEAPTEIEAETVTIGDAGYATYVTKQDVSFPDAVEAYIGAVNGGLLKMTKVAAVAEGTPVILKGNKGTYELTPASANDLADVSTNELKASDGTVEADGTQYVLAKVNGLVAFYKVEKGSTIAAGKAYLEVPGSAGVKAFYFDGDAETAINEVNGQSSMINGQSIYNLAGQRINKLQKGINIVNGKKVLK